MNPFLNSLSGSIAGTPSHAHLLVAESGGMVLRETSQAVMAEVEFRTTHVSSLLEEMFEETKKHDCFWEPDVA